MRSNVWLPTIWLAALWLFFFAVPARAQVALGMPGRANATPSIAADGEFVAVVWGGARPDGTTDVFFAASRNGGRAFGAPVRVNQIAGDARLNGEQPPHVALIHRARLRAEGRSGTQAVDDPAIVVVWTTKGKNGTTLQQARSDDGGKSFTAATLVPGSDAAGNRGWEAIAVEPNGRVDVVWLDHRELASDSGLATSHHDHAAMVAGKASAQKPDGVAMAQKSKLFFASTDGAVAPRSVTGGVCYCCKTALVAAANRTIYAAWRHVYPGNLRDMAFTISRDGGKTFAEPIRVSEDQWVLEGCPDDGPAMAVDAQQRIHIVWPTLVKEGDAETIALFYATSSDGRTFSTRQRIPTSGLAHHPRIVASADGVLTLAWDERANGMTSVVVAHATAGAHPTFTRETLTKQTASVYPTLAASGDGVVAAWTKGSGSSASIHVTRLAQAGGTR
jgi:hypothetical protein